MIESTEKLVIYAAYNKTYEVFSYFSTKKNALAYKKFRIKKWKRDVIKIIKIIVDEDLAEMEIK